MENNVWTSVSDLFSGLMIVFLFIAIAMMLETEKESDAVKDLELELNDIADRFYKDKILIYKSLKEEFEHDFERWDAELTEDLSIRFKNPDILFKNGSFKLSNKFELIIENFWPRYLKIISSNLNNISYVSIEGHTSSFWCSSCSDKKSYFKNMELSQKRAYSVLEHCWSVTDEKKVVKDIVVASGLSYSRPVFVDGVESPELSKRVEFSIKLNAEKNLDIIRSISSKDIIKNKSKR
jgi:outer membrane protein OmpA-like peptidoglycan-associated protein